MPRVHLTVACGGYDRTEALRDGRVVPEGIELTYLALEAEEAFWRMLRHMEFDVAEVSMGAYVARRDRGATDLVAIPVFPSRAFRHASVYVPASSSVSDPHELIGGRVGVPEYRMTAAVWVRGFLEEDYGVAPSAVTWVQGGLEQPGRRPAEGSEPAGVPVVDAPPGRSLSALLADGEIDALVSARVPSALAEGRVRRIFADPWTESRAYYERTRIFPIMHVIAVRRVVLERDPWIATSLYKAFESAKELALAELADESALRTSLPFQVPQWRDATDLMGPDPWSYGVEGNRHVLDAFLRLAHSQGVTARRLAIEDLFAPATLDTHRI